MSTLNVANISDGTDTVETGYVVNGSAKAWCHWAGTSTINDSRNVSSITDHGTGDFTNTFTNAFDNSNYSYVGSVQNNPSVAAGVIVLFGQAVGSFRTTTEQSNNFAAYDAGINCTQACGDLA